MKRYYVCDVIGSGTEEDFYRAAVADLGVNHVAVIPVGPDGRPTSPWCLALVAASDHARVEAHPGVDRLLDVSLDVQWNAADKMRRDEALAALARRGISAPAVAPGDGYRVFLRGLGRLLDPNFSEDRFDVSE